MRYHHNQDSNSSYLTLGPTTERWIFKCLQIKSITGILLELTAMLRPSDIAPKALLYKPRVMTRRISIYSVLYLHPNWSTIYIIHIAKEICDVKYSRLTCHYTRALHGERCLVTPVSYIRPDYRDVEIVSNFDSLAERNGTERNETERNGTEQN